VIFLKYIPNPATIPGVVLKILRRFIGTGLTNSLNAIGIAVFMRPMLKSKITSVKNKKN